MSSQNLTLQLMVRSLIGLGIFCALLFGGAGTLAWSEGWLYIVVQVSSSMIVVLWLRSHNPELLQDRMNLFKRIVKPWDKAIVILLIVASGPFFVLPGIDAVRYRWSDIAPLLKIIGFMGLLASSGLIFWVMKSNPYASAAVEVQRERGHTTVTTGPYRFVRHPMYAGAILWFVSTPLALGSFTTFIPGIVLTILIVVRTYLEDGTLHQELEGYTTYAKRVKSRLIPGVW